MYEKVIIPLALVVIGAVLTGVIQLYLKTLEKNLDNLKKVIQILFWLFIVIAISLLVIGSLILPLTPTDPNAVRTSIALTSSKLEIQIGETQTAGTSTAIALATEDIVTWEQMTATQAAKVSQVIIKIKANPDLCKYKDNPFALETDANSYRLVAGALIITLALAIISLFSIFLISKFRLVFGILSVFFGVGVFVLSTMYFSHPFSELPNGPATLKDERFRQVLLQECQNIQIQDSIVRNSFVDEFDNNDNGWVDPSPLDNLTATLTNGTMSLSPSDNAIYGFKTCLKCRADESYKNYRFDIVFSVSEPSVNVGIAFACPKENYDCMVLNLNPTEQKYQFIGFGGPELFLVPNLAPADYGFIHYVPDHDIKITLAIANKQAWIYASNDMTKASALQFVDRDAGGYFGIFTYSASGNVSIKSLSVTPLIP